VDPNPEFGFVKVFFLKFSIFTVGIRIAGGPDLIGEDSDPGFGSVKGTYSFSKILSAFLPGSQEYRDFKSVSRGIRPWIRIREGYLHF